MPRSVTPPAGYGDLDGEVIELVSVTLTGGAGIARKLEAGERLVLIVDGYVSPAVTVKRIDGRLVRVHKVTVETLAEPLEALADEATRFLELIVNAERGREPLPFDEEPTAEELDAIEHELDDDDEDGD